MAERQLVVNGVNYNFEDRGAGDEVIFFGHGLMYSWEIFAHQVAHFANHNYRCIAIDWRGQGKTEGAGAAEDYDMYRLGDDAAALLRELGVESCHWVGVSMGAMIAMRLYERKPELFRSLTMIDSSAADAPDLLPMYTQMAETFREYGAIPPLLQALDHEFYTSNFIEQNDLVVNQWHAYWKQADRESLYKAVLPVINRDDVSDKVAAIDVPSLIMVGEQDNSTPVARSEDLHRRIKNSQLITIPQASHMAVVEQPHVITEALDAFLKRVAAQHSS